MLDQHASMQKPPPRRWGLLGATYVVTPRASIMQLRQFRFGAQKCTSCGRRLRTSHVCLETILPQPRYGSARSKAGDLASRQEGATAEKAVPFSKLRLSIVIEHQSPQVVRSHGLAIDGVTLDRLFRDWPSPLPLPLHGRAAASLSRFNKRSPVSPRGFSSFEQGDVPERHFRPRCL
jgi:hypothetical protein